MCRMISMDIAAAHGDQWRGNSFCRTREVLLQPIAERCGEVDPTALDPIRALPDRYRRARHDRAALDELWVNHHLAATAHLLPAEMGSYDRLLFIMWQHGGWLPNDPKLLARYCRMTVKQWERVAPIVMGFFEAVDLDEGPSFRVRVCVKN